MMSYMLKICEKQFPFISASATSALLRETTTTYLAMRLVHDKGLFLPSEITSPANIQVRLAVWKIRYINISTQIQIA